VKLVEVTMNHADRYLQENMASCEKILLQYVKV
jgi:hypothetical protein